MRYRLELREISENDLNPETAFMPEEGSFEIYSNSFFEDIQNSEGVSDVVRVDSNAVEFNSGSALEELKEKFAAFVRRDLPHLRIRTFESM